MRQSIADRIEAARRGRTIADRLNRVPGGPCPRCGRAVKAEQPHERHDGRVWHTDPRDCR